MVERREDPAATKNRTNTSSKWVDGTAGASWVPCGWGRRAALAQGQEWSAVKKKVNTISNYPYLF